MLSSYLTVMLLLVVGGQSEIISDEYVLADGEKLGFGELSTFIETEEQVFSLEADLRIPGNVLFSGDYTIRTTNGQGSTTLAGHFNEYGYVNGVGDQARFMVVYLLQLNSETVLIADMFNDCIRQFARSTNAVSDFAGNCTNGGHLDGVVNEALFMSPTSLTRDVEDPNIVYVLETEGTIRTIDIDKRSVGTLPLRTSMHTYGIQSLYGNRLAFFNITTFNILNLTDMSITEYGGQRQGNNDGELEQATFEFLYDVAVVYNDVYILSDLGNNKLRVVDIASGVVTSICNQTNVKMYIDGPIDSCHFKYPQGLTYADNMLYIGDKQGIRVLPVNSSNSVYDGTRTPVPSTSTKTVANNYVVILLQTLATVIATLTIS